MGTRHKDGYSAEVTAHFVIQGDRLPLAKTNYRTIVLVGSCELAPGTQGEIEILVDGTKFSRFVTLPAGVSRGQSIVPYVASSLT
jgi:hypothetical protein